jgi:phage terminase large subunit GpA-like protein
MPPEPLTSAGLHDQAARWFLPPERLTVGEYAAAHRIVASEVDGIARRWRAELAPYVVGPMDALTAPHVRTVVLAGPGQAAKTTVAECWLHHSIVNAPADFLWYMQTDPGVTAYVKKRINTMIDMHPEIRANLGLRPIDDSVHFKRFRGMVCEFLSATMSNFINKNAPFIVADEVDAYPATLGDVKVLLDVRRQSFGDDSMLLAMSHPDRARGLDPESDWTDGIMSLYADSDRRVWYWPCPQCGAWSSPAPIAARVMTIAYTIAGSLDEVERSARLVCPVNGCLIEDHHRRAMNLAAFRSAHGGWIGEGQTIAEDGTVTGEKVKRRTAGFWIVGAMSPFIMGGIGGLARARVKAERELEAGAEDGDQSLRQVMVKMWGVPYVAPRKVGNLDANVIAERAETHLRLAEVPDGVRFLTAAVDVQLAHFEVLVRGWGAGGESWVVDWFRLAGGGGFFSPATSGEDWDALLEAAILKTYPLSDGSGRRMPIRGVGYDSGGAPGVTLQAGDAWMRWKAAKHIRLLGKSEGRDVWSVMPTKGATGRNPPRLQVTYPNTQRKGKLASGTVPQLLFAPNAFKDDLAGQLSRAEPGHWYVHFPAALLSRKKPHLWFEQLVAEERDLIGRWSKPHNAVRNEAMDLMVISDAIARLHGLARINWERPPAWAAPWDKNPAILPPQAAESEPPAPEGPIGARVTVAKPAVKPGGKLSSRLA